MVYNEKNTEGRNVMGKIIAIGGGFENYEPFFIVDHVMGLCEKEHPHYLQIPTTCEDGADRGMLSRFFNNGCEVDTLFLTHAYITEEMVAEKIRWADIINVPGGNLNFCMTFWKKTHADKYLREAFEQGKVLFGTSSGSMCWFREGYDDCGPHNDMMFVDGLDLLPYCNCPHYENQFWNRFTEDIKTRKISGIACENDTALCFIDDKRYILTSGIRPDARVWFFDANDNFKRYDLKQHPEILEKL